MGGTQGEIVRKDRFPATHLFPSHALQTQTHQPPMKSQPRNKAEQKKARIELGSGRERETGGSGVRLGSNPKLEICHVPNPGQVI